MAKQREVCNFADKGIRLRRIEVACFGGAAHILLHAFSVAGVVVQREKDWHGCCRPFPHPLETGASLLAARLICLFLTLQSCFLC